MLLAWCMSRISLHDYKSWLCSNYIRYILNWVQISQKMLYVWLKSALESEFRETEQCDFRSPDYLNICWPNEDKTILKLDTHTSSNVKKGHFTPSCAWPLVHSLVILLRCSHWVIMISDKIGNCLNFLKKINHEHAMYADIVALLKCQKLILSNRNSNCNFELIGALSKYRQIRVV